MSELYYFAFYSYVFARPRNKLAQCCDSFGGVILAHRETVTLKIELARKLKILI